MTTVTVHGRGRSFRAERVIPGDKSLSHRALVFSAVARGSSRISGRSPGRDVRATARVLRALGVVVEERGVSSPGRAAWRAPTVVLDCGNSGTTMRLLAGALAGRPFRSVLDGDASLRRRPMGRLVAPLRALGGSVETAPGGTPPVTAGGAGRLHGAEVGVNVASAQVRTAVALAALEAEGATRIDSPPGFRDHTERWLAAWGLGEWVGDTAFRIRPGPVPADRYRIPGDASSAAYLWATAASIPGAVVETPAVVLNPGRTGFLDVLERMGAAVVREETGVEHGDPGGRARGRGEALRGVVVEGLEATRAIDELPLVGVLAAFARGETVVRDAAELRAKESDRVRSTVAMVRALGGEAEALADGFTVAGSGTLRGGVVDAAGDHRIAMAAAVAAGRTRAPVTILGAEVAAVSWPGFFETLEAVWSSR